MLKKFAIILLLALPLSAFAQDLKFGHIDRTELLKIMPEAIEAQKKLESLVLEYRMKSAALEEELQKGFKEFQENQASLPAAVRADKEAALNQLYERIQSFGATAQEDLQKTQLELMAPIENKINNAIEAIGKEEGFMYIFDVQAQAILYFSTKSIDVLPLVKKKLNLK